MHVRVAREGAGRRLIAALAAFALAAGCGGAPDGASLALTVSPAAPMVGTPATLRMSLRRADGTPLPATSVRVEAHMAHPGMPPVLPHVVQTGEGRYESRLQFSMAGDWLIAVTGDLPDGRRFTLQAPVSGVKPKPR
jgi:hypothetical protein